MSNIEEDVRLIPVTKEDPDVLSVFWELGRDYLSDLPPDERERFLKSILARQGERDRWLLLLRSGDEYIGLVHMKIDREERPGWGFILEFYIVPDKRRLGWGTRLFNLVVAILKDRHVKNIWLLTNQRAKPFWLSLGFKETGEIDKETGQIIMIKSL